MSRITDLNLRAQRVVEGAVRDAELLRIGVDESTESNVTLLDFGVNQTGGISAGLVLARICMSDLADVSLQPAADGIDVPRLTVHTDHPVEACLLSQYAGWKIASDDYFAMGSGPIRARIRTEELFEEFETTEVSPACTAVLEAGNLPSTTALQLIRSAVGGDDDINLAVAPTASQAGNIQVVARSVETAMHKLHEIGFPTEKVMSGCGTTPLPPVAKDDLTGIGRTNDSILYGCTVNLWVDCTDELIETLGPQAPSESSDSHGRSFLDLFREANHDFYALDKALFSPAVVVFHNLASGNSYRFGQLLPELLNSSFGI